MKNLNLITIFLFIFVISSCATLPPQKPIETNSSIIGISIELDKFGWDSYPKTIYLVKLNENENIISDSMIIISDFQYDDHLYLLNVEPGHYIVIAAFEEITSNNQDGSTSTNYSTYYFPEKLIKLTEVKVKKGDISYLGHYIVDVPFSLSYGLNKPDEAQLHYCKRLQPNKIDPTTGSCLMEAIFALLGSTTSAHAVLLKEHRKDSVSELEFLEKAKDHFKGGFLQRIVYKNEVEDNKVWIEIIENKIKNLMNEPK